MAYVDGFVLCVPKKNLAAYKKIATAASKVWKKHGALAYYECAADDMKAEGCLPFPKLAKPKTGETIVFSWIVYKSKAQRASIMKKVMQDKKLAELCKNGMPFDVKRMAYGGFKPLVAA